MTIPISVAIITKNEEAAISECVGSVITVFDQVVVFDSESEDDTVQLARHAGAQVITFRWDGKYPKKKQSALVHPDIRNSWVLLLDADERVTDALVDEIRECLAEWESTCVAAVETPLRFHWLGTPLRHGYVVRKHTLLHRDRARFPDAHDELAPGITEVEGHYQPVLAGGLARARNHVEHRDPGSFSEWIARHNKYSDWEAYIATSGQSTRNLSRYRSSRGRLFYGLRLKALLFFAYSYVYKQGYRDGSPGFEYAMANSMYYWMIGVKIREIKRDRG